MSEIRGPSALGGGWIRFFRLTWLVSITDFKLDYVGTYLGYFWTLMRPLLLFGVLYTVFTKIFRFGGSIKDYPVLLLLNIMLFTFFADATSRAVASVVSQESLVRKMQFPRLVIPLSVVVTAALNMCLNLVAVFVFMLIYGIHPMWTWLLLPVLLVGLLVLTTSVSMLLAASFVRFRDVSIIWAVLSTGLLYGTPVLYGIETVPPNLRAVVNANPLAPIFEQARVWIIDPSAPTPAEAVGHSWQLLIPLGLTIGLAGFAAWFYNREAARIAEDL